MKRFLLSLTLLLIIGAAQAQTHRCGNTELRAAIIKRYPQATELLQRKPVVPAKTNTTTQRTTAQYEIPVIFHIVLTQAQLNLIGGTEGVARRMESQLLVLNEDFNALNPDTADIPAPFKPLLGNAGLRFAAARVAPDGSASPGYEIKVITRTGIEVYGGEGSAFAFSDAKYATGGGLNAWAPDSYMNVWIINPLDGGQASNILGVCIPPYFVQQAGIPHAELGVVLHYGTFGRRAQPTEYYINTNSNGRTLTHELGHYFDLLHVWGDDDGACPTTGGEDDGIGDTPPQSAQTYGCPTFPKYDACSPAGSNGIMFMNFMDYVNDGCMHMFSSQQASVMRGQVAVGGPSYSLTQFPGLTQPPGGEDLQSFDVYPNPGAGLVSIVFSRVQADVQGITAYDMQGMLVREIQVSQPAAYYSVDLTTAAKGIYFIRVLFANKAVVRKVVVY